MEKNENIALYRKYRPSAWKEVLGQEHVVSVLESSIKNNTISHAYLFAGTRGTGKTTVARILAREIGTSERDLYEIDAASNRGIDEIRALREAVATLPFESPRKVYIIDEAHMLTKEAWNALLKTLEEPPKHVVFIFATTELQKVPDTIQSRCLSFGFRKPTSKLLADLLMKTAKKEGASLEVPAAELLALLADGSYRDAYGMLEKAIVGKGKTAITLQDIEEVAGAPSAQLVNNFLVALAEKNAEHALAVISKAEDGNIDTALFLRLILEKTRAILLFMHAPELRKDLEREYSAEDLAFIQTLASQRGNITSKTLIALLDAAVRLPRSPISSLPLELAVLALTSEEG